MSLPAYAMKTETFPALYERVLVAALFRPWAEQLLDGIDLTRARSVLDVACGTGIAARVARDRLRGGARIVGVDISEPMLAVARRAAPELDWRQGDAAALPVAAEERFDVVICQQGLQFFAARGAAAGEMRRVLAPGGTVTVATWVASEEAPLYCDLQRIAERHVGPVTDQRHSFGEPRCMEQLLLAAGLVPTTVATVSRVVRFADPAAFVRMNAMALIGMAQMGEALSDAARARLLSAIERESTAATMPFVEGTELVFETRAIVATARG